MRVVRMQKSCKIFVDEIYFHKFTTTRFNWAIYHQIKDSLYFQIAVFDIIHFKIHKEFSYELSNPIQEQFSKSA